LRRAARSRLAQLVRRSVPRSGIAVGASATKPAGAGKRGPRAPAGRRQVGLRLRDTGRSDALGVCKSSPRGAARATTAIERRRWLERRHHRRRPCVDLLMTPTVLAHPAIAGRKVSMSRSTRGSKSRSPSARGVGPRRGRGRRQDPSRRHVFFVLHLFIQLRQWSLRRNRRSCPRKAQRALPRRRFGAILGTW
jgi:hypothetical protein